jgi:hypothetical protein
VAAGVAKPQIIFMRHLAKKNAVQAMVLKRNTNHDTLFLKSLIVEHKGRSLNALPVSRDGRENKIEPLFSFRY